MALSGPLSAGKTTFTQELLRQLGYVNRVTSPTFVLEKRYPVAYKDITEVIHLDFYRLTLNELDSFGWKEYLGAPGTLTVIEWPEIAKQHLPSYVKQIKFEVVDEQKRRLKFSKNFGKKIAG